MEYEAELFAGMPPARTLPGSFTNINQQWYLTIKITNGTANFSDAQATIHYEASDGIADPSVLRIGKDDGGANWLDIGGTGTASPAGSITSNTFTSFSDFVLANITGGPLPVTLQNFSGIAINQSVQLNWQVANEFNFSQFVVERSMDGANYTTTGITKASGAATYTLIDAQLPATAYVFYRLKMVDKDGRFNYSNVIRVSLASILNNRIITIAPNPFVNTLIIQYKSIIGQNMQIQLLDVLGKVVKSNRYSLLEGNNQLQFYAGDLPKGTYLLKMTTNTSIVTEKIIKN